MSADFEPYKVDQSLLSLSLVWSQAFCQAKAKLLVSLAQPHSLGRRVWHKEIVEDMPESVVRRLWFLAFSLRFSLDTSCCRYPKFRSVWVQRTKPIPVKALDSVMPGLGQRRQGASEVKIRNHGAIDFSVLLLCTNVSQVSHVIPIYSMWSWLCEKSRL